MTPTPTSTTPRTTTTPAPGAHRPAPVPALARGLALLQLLIARPAPASAGALARELNLARSTVYELLGELARAGFVVHLPDRRQWGLGVAAFEIGSAYLRGEPLERLGRPQLERLASRSGATAHLGVLHGWEILYLVNEKPPRTGPTLVTDVGVRLPASLTATGLSMLAGLPAAQVRALLPESAAFVVRTDRGATSLPALRAVLTATRRRGWAVEDGLVSADTASVAAPVFDHNGRPLAAVGVTFGHRCAGPVACGAEFAEMAGPVRSVAAALTAAIGGRPG